MTLGKGKRINGVNFIEVNPGLLVPLVRIAEVKATGYEPSRRRERVAESA